MDFNDVDPFDPCRINVKFRVGPFGRRLVNRIAADMHSRPDLTVNLTIGRGLWRRSGRMTITGPFYAIRPALDALRDHITN